MLAILKGIEGTALYRVVWCSNFSIYDKISTFSPAVDVYFDEQQKAVSIYSLTAFWNVCLYKKSTDYSLF